MAPRQVISIFPPSRRGKLPRADDSRDASMRALRGAAADCACEESRRVWVLRGDAYRRSERFARRAAGSSGAHAAQPAPLVSFNPLVAPDSLTTHDGMGDR